MIFFFRCDNDDCTNCSGGWRSSWKEVIPDRFRPGPTPFVHTNKGPAVPNPNVVAGASQSWKWMPLHMRLASKIPIPGEFFIIIDIILVAVYYLKHSIKM